MRQARRILAMVLVMVLAVHLCPAVPFTAEAVIQKQTWAGLGGATVVEESNGSRIDNGRMYMEQTVNLPVDGIVIDFTINQIPAYNEESGEDGWIALYLSDVSANTDNCGVWCGNNGFQFIIRGLNSAESANANKLRIETSVAAGGNVFHKGSTTSGWNVLGRHQLVFFSRGKNADGLDVYAGYFDGVLIADDAEGFDFSATRLSVGMNLLEGQNGSITINSVASYTSDADADWAGMNQSVTVDGNGVPTIVNDKAYFSQTLNIPADGVVIDFTVNEVPAYNTDTGNDGWIGLFISSNANLNNCGSWCGNDGFQFLFRGLTTNAADPNKARIEMYAAAGGNAFPKGNVNTVKSAVGRHQLIFYVKGQDPDTGMNIYSAYFDGMPFADDIEGFDMSRATLSVGVYNPIADSTGSITINSVRNYVPLAEPEWTAKNGATIFNDNDDEKVVNGTMYYNEAINLEQDGLKIKFTINEIPSYHTDNGGVDGWIGLFISSAGANPDGYGNWCGNDGFQFLFRGLTASEDAAANKIQAARSATG